MNDRMAVVWTRLGGAPRKTGSLYLTEHEARFTYTAEFVDSGLPGLGFVLAPEFFGTTTIARPRSEPFMVHPPLQALIPPRGERNFNRALITRYLEQRGISRATHSPEEIEWEALLLAGHGGIGHLDVFSSDEAADAWYSQPAGPPTLHPVGDDFGFSLKRFLTWFDDDAEALLEVIGPTPTVGGAIPKLLLSIPTDGWDGTIGLPTRRRMPDAGRTDVVLKIEQSAAYPGIIELEALTLELHREAGFSVPRFWPVELGDGIRALAVERFDRDPQGVPLMSESIYSILASADPTLAGHYDAPYDDIASALLTPRIQLVDDRRAAARHLFERLLLALLTGNGDLHLSNLSLLRDDRGVAFSPIYDPTPMRAYSIHNALTPGSMSFGGYGEYIGRRDEPVGFAEALSRFAKALKIGSKEQRGLIEKAIRATAAYADRVAALSTVPSENRDRLIRIHREIAEKLTASSRVAEEKT